MTQMQGELNLSLRSLEIMRAIKEHGGFICTGSCMQIKKGQLHCRNLGNMLGMGPSAIWEVINDLHQKGILKQGSLENPITLNLTARGKEILAEAITGT
ncbi:MAG: hypothetical protein AB1815_04075 [Bacillota bacterium]|jgi:DNA-binding MarR family transcriptional regulator